MRFKKKKLYAVSKYLSSPDKRLSGSHVFPTSEENSAVKHRMKQAFVAYLCAHHSA